MREKEGCRANDTLFYFFGCIWMQNSVGQYRIDYIRFRLDFTMTHFYNEFRRKQDHRKKDRKVTAETDRISGGQLTWQRH